MLLGHAWDNYKKSTEAFSDNARKLAFAVAAICWFFRVENKTQGSAEINFPPLITISLLLIVLFILFDVSQYLSQALLLRNWVKKEEKRLKCEKRKEGNYKGLQRNMNIKIPEKLSAPALRLLYTKTAALYLACVFLLLHFIKMILL